MPRWAVRFLKKLAVKLLLWVLREYLTEAEHASVVKTVTAKINIRS